jgi:hypothetical protein
MRYLASQQKNGMIEPSTNHERLNMSDTASNNSGNSDPLVDAAKRAEEAVNKSDPATDSGTAAYGTGFGEIDLGGDSQTPELDLAEPAPKKPKIAKPAILQDEQWEDDGWANDQPGMAPLEPRQATSSEQPTTQSSHKDSDKPKPQLQQLRKAALPPKEAGKPVPEQESTQPKPPREKEGPFIRVSAPPRPKKNWGPLIKWTTIIVVIAGCIAGAIIGYSKWQQSQKAKEQAQLDALNQGSLQSLKREAVKKGKLGT